MEFSIQNQRINRRLGLIGLVFAVPFTALTVWLLAKGIHGHIEFAQQELRGNAVQRPLETLLRLAGRAQIGTAAGEVAPSESSAIDQAFADLDAALGEHGDALQFTPAGLAQRHREALEPSAIRQRWRSATTGQVNVAATAALMTDVRGLIAHGGDTSNLILDPDLDSYYLMDVTLCVLPELQERIATVTAKFVPALRTGTPDAGTQRDALVQAAMLRDVNTARIDSDLATTLNEDANFYGVSPSLATELNAAAATWHHALDAFIAQVDGLAAGNSTVTAATLAAAGREAHEASFAFWAKSATELDRLLQRRIAAKQSEQYRGLGALALLVLVASGTTWWIARGINIQLRSLCAGLTTRSTELGELARAVNSTSDTLARGASQQAAALEEIGATIEEISGTSRHNSESVLRTKELADGMRTAAESGSQDIGDMARAMDAIQSSSDNIAKIIKTIDEIAFQTNILALNAAVEAARAGEAGAGFAVVADEVRTLAQRAAAAARETTERIDDSIAKSRDGVAITKKVTEGFTAITGKAREVNELVAQITEAAQEQDQGIAQVNKAVSELDKVTQAEAAHAEEAAANAAQLEANSRALGEAVDALVNIVERRARPRLPNWAPGAITDAEAARLRRPASQSELAHAPASAESVAVLAER
ncbi:MAG: hypothetical protein KF715_08730 [Candidatus Didemnitutus sp.]|nr:hypothetical protein [Candidatus Didemnitutus sp.]